MVEALTKMSVEAFLAWENEQVEKHEFHRGEVFAMVGARRVHGRVASNIVYSLTGQLNEDVFDGIEPAPGQQAALTV